MSDVRSKIRSFIAENFLLDSSVKLGDDDSLLQLQIVDSTGFLELVSFLETNFSIQVRDDEMVPENLETVNNIIGFLERKRGATA